MENIVVSENTVKDWVRKTLAQFSIPNWPVSAGVYSVSGLSDRIAVGPGGVFCAFECKGGVFRKKEGWQRKNVTNAQKAFLKRVEDNGGKAYIIGPREALVLPTTLMYAFPVLLTDENVDYASRTKEMRGRHLQRIVNRGF